MKKQTRQELNLEINKLYRQLGKEVYESQQNGETTTVIFKKRFKQIEKRIQRIEKMNFEGVTMETEKIVLEPEVNKDGIGMYQFCKKCRVGNNPLSTHCISCGEALN